MPPLVTRVLYFTVAMIVALFLFTQYLRRTSMFFPSQYPVGDWNVPGAQDEWFRTRDGVKLHGWLFRAAGANAPLIVWFHGNGGNVTDRAPIAAEFARRGISVFVFDWRGYGRSEGTPTEGALYRDAMAAYEFATKSLHVAPENLVIYGESVGGPYAAYVASHAKARCVVIENSFPSLAAMGNAMYRPIPLGIFAPFAMRTTRWLNDANLPVLVMHGKPDEVIPFALGKELFDGLRVPKRMFVSEHAGHCEIPSIEGERYYTTVIDFIRKPQ